MSLDPEEAARHHCLLALARHADAQADAAQQAYLAAERAKAPRQDLEYLRAVARFWTSAAERARRSPGYAADHRSAA